MKKIESGRSMIEMLGVLAIVGVLSIGGLAGYTMAMNRYRASNLSDYVSRCVVVAQTKSITGRIGTNTDCATVLGEDVPGWLTNSPTITLAEDTSDGAITATVKSGSLPSAVNQVLVERFDGTTSIGGVQYTTGGIFKFLGSATS